MTETYQQKMAELKAKFPNVLTMSPYDMVVFSQKQFNRKENEILSGDLLKLDAAMQLLRSEHQETIDAIKDQDFAMLRDGIADQLTIALYLAFSVADLHNFEPTPNQIRADSYKEYNDQVNEKLQKLDLAIVGKKNVIDIGVETLASTATKEEKQAAFEDYVNALYSLPNGSKIDMHSDLLDVTLSTLSKVCPTQEVAKATLDSYVKKGYLVHIAESISGWVILVSEDHMVNGELIPKNKFLKNINWLECVLPPIDETPVWS